MRVFLVAVISLLIGGVDARADMRVLTIATGDYEPYTGQNLPDGGIVNRLVQQIVEKAGYVPDFKYMPWKRTLEATRRGMYDVSSYWLYSEERDADFVHVGPVIEVREVFFVRADANVQDWTSLEDFAGLRIGVVPGYTYTQEFWDLVDAGVLTVFESTSDEANLKKLRAGRIDVFPSSEVAGWRIIEAEFGLEGAAQFAAMDRPLSVSNGYLLLPRRNPETEEIAAAMQTALDAHMSSR